jgi:hypothetical protein
VSIGPSRLRLIRQTVTESLLLAAVGGIASVLAALWGTEGLVRILTSGRDRIAVDVPLDWHVLVFTFGIAIFTGILFGLGPALPSSRSAPMNSLKASVSGTETRSGRLYGDGMVTLQISMAVAILSCALLFVSRLQDLRSPQNLGFHRESVLMVSIDLPRAAHPRSQLRELYDSLTDRLRKVRGVTSVALSSAPLLCGGGESHFVEVEGIRKTGRTAGTPWLIALVRNSSKRWALRSLPAVISVRTMPSMNL